MLLEADAGGRDGDGRVLALLHGMGTTREVWTPLISVLEQDWNGRWIAPDLRGHGRSPHARSYTLGAHAGDVAETVAALISQPSMVVILGHSMGGVIALALASGWFGLQPHAALGLGIKIAWRPEELDSLAARACAPAKTFKSADETAAFYLKVSGLTGLVGVDAPMARAGLGAGGLRLAADPATAQFGPPPMTGLVAAARAPIHLAAGENDPMATLGDMRAHDADAELIQGAGHNAMIEAPERVWAWVKECIA